MAEQRQEQQRQTGMSREEIDADLEVVGSDAKYLPEYVEDWDPEGNSDAEVAFRVEWNSIIYGRLSCLERAHLASEMTPDQERRYEDLKGLIKERMPLIERLDLAKPQVPLDPAR